MQYSIKYAIGQTIYLWDNPKEYILVEILLDHKIENNEIITIVKYVIKDSGGIGKEINEDEINYWESCKTRDIESVFKF